MNIQFIESLADTIKALSPQERKILEQKLPQKAEWQSLRTKILNDATSISEPQETKPFPPDITHIIHQMREERDQELLNGLESIKVNL